MAIVRIYSALPVKSQSVLKQPYTI
jgi:hypothetical protein